MEAASARIALRFRDSERLTGPGSGQTFPGSTMANPAMLSVRGLAMRTRLLAAVAVVAVGIPACAQVPLAASPESSPSRAREATSISMPTASPTSRPSSTPEPTSTPMQTLTPTSEPSPTATTQPTPTPQPQVYVTVQRVHGYASPEGEEIGYMIPGKPFVILEQQGGWLRIRTVPPPSGLPWEGWIQASDTAYVQAPRCEVERCECHQDIGLYRKYSDQESFSRLVPGTSKVFVVIERRDGRMFIDVTEPGGDTWQAWADDLPGTYGLVGQRPGPPSPLSCQAPHYQNRTEDRKTGLIISFGNYRHEVHDPDTSPYAPYYNGAYWKRFHIPGYGSNWVYVRDARIVSLDRGSGVLEFYVGGGLSVQRQFTQHTDVLMAAHEVYRGMKSTDSTMQGGNLCDVEVGDMVSVLHPTLDEAQYLDPNLVDLWGVLIVQ